MAPADRPRPGFLRALWLALIGCCLVRKSPSPALPIPATARAKHCALIPYDPTPLKRPSSTARTASACRSRSVTPARRDVSDPERIFHPPASPFPNISLSGLFATSPLASPPRTPDVELGLSPEVQPLATASACSPSPFRGSGSPSLHTLHSRSPHTPRTPSSAVIVRLDRSPISPTTMSDGSLEVISLGDRRGSLSPPVNIERLPSPWSPVGRKASPDVWISVDGTLRNASGLVDVLGTPIKSRNNSMALRTPAFSPLTVSRISAASLYSSPSALDALGISVFVDLDEKGNKDDAVSTPRLNQVRDENRPTLVTQGPQTPRKRRESHPSVAGSNGPGSRVTKGHSTPLTKRDNASHVHSTGSISSMAYELRLGLFSDGRSVTAFENIISFLDQASPVHHNEPVVEMV